MNSTKVVADPAVVMDSPINDVVAIGTDQHMEMAYVLGRGGELDIFAIDEDDENGFRLLQRRDLSSEFFGGKKPTAWFTSPLSSTIAAGFADGSVMPGVIYFSDAFFNFEDEVANLPVFKDLGIKETAVSELTLQVPADPMAAAAAPSAAAVDEKRAEDRAADDGAGAGDGAAPCA